MHRPLDRSLAIGLIVVVALLAGNAVLAYRNTRQLYIDAHAVARTHEIVNALDDVLSTMKDAETGQRGYLITGDRGYLEPYENALATVEGKLAALKELARNNERLQSRIPGLETLIRAKTEELKAAVARRKTEGFEAAQKEVLTHLGKKRMDAIRVYIADMQGGERDLLHSRQTESERTYVTSLVSGTIASLAALAALAAFAGVLRRHLQAAAQLQEQRELLRTTLASIGDAVIATDEHGRVTFLNPVAQALTGWSEVEAKGQALESVFRIVNEKSRQPVENPALRALKEGIAVGLANHTILIARDGTERAIDDIAAPIRLHGGTLAGVVFVFRDVTERRVAEAQAQKFREIFQLAHRIGKIGHWDWNSLTDDNTWSPEIEALYGLPPGGFAGGYQGWLKLLHPDDVPRAEEDVRRALETGKYFTEFRVVWPDGSIHWLEARANVFKDEHDRPVRIMGVNMDVTERKEAEMQLRDADRRKDEFLATLAHELRNPLAPIRNAVEILGRAAGNPELIERARSIMARQLEQMVRLIDDLLDMSRISQGKVPLRKERMDVAAAVHSAVEAVRPFIETQAEELTVTLPSEAIAVNADPMRLAQVIANVLHNAAKYTEPGGHIWLSVTRDGGEVVISVRDTGIGIAAEHLPRIFEIFSQVAPALERSHGGLGIGLSLVRGLVRLHGGTAEAHSRGVGMGSEFVVRLPVADALVPPPPEEPGQRDTRAAARKCRILAVDDNRDATDSLALMLRVMGHEVRTAYDGHEAVQAAATFQPDVIFLDIGLPRMNGYEAARHIREQRGGEGMTLIALTGWGQDEDKRRAFEAGFHHHMTKPVDAAGLEKLLRLLPPVRDRTA
jgi:PAS domain S-box-containing protein